MIIETTGNLLESKTEAIINTVNTVGVMGKGIALQFKQAFTKDYFNDYQRACKNKELQIGKVHIYSRNTFENPHFIINFPTKKHWKGKSKLEDIEAGLKDLVKVIKERNIKSIAMPPLGCGNGGLDWSDVKPLIEKTFAEIPKVELLLYVPSGSPKADEIKISTERPNMTSVRAAFLLLFERYFLLGYNLSFLEVQKLAYFLQEAGENLQLSFAKQKFGPYADKVNHLLQRIDGHFIKGFGDNTQSPFERTIYLIPEALEKANNFLLENNVETSIRLGKVFNLIEGFEYPHGLELLSSVHWVVKENPSTKDDVEKVINLVHGWNERKRKVFPEKEIKIAWQHLKEHNWI
jgi:O-acetyl-ADP-ribose deacetylase (regulator of RNase III)